MAQRFNVSLPDDLVERLEPFKADLSLSQVLQQALEAEIRNHLRSNSDQQRSQALLIAAKNYWIQKRKVLHYSVEAFVEYLISEALQDNDCFIFDIYRRLQCESPEKVLEEIFHDEELEKTDRIDDEYENPRSSFLFAKLMYFFNRFSGEDELIAQCFTGLCDIDELQSVNPEEGRWYGGDLAEVIKDVLSARLDYYLGAEGMGRYLT